MMLELWAKWKDHAMRNIVKSKLILVHRSLTELNRNFFYYLHKAALESYIDTSRKWHGPKFQSWKDRHYNEGHSYHIMPLVKFDILGIIFKKGEYLIALVI